MNAKNIAIFAVLYYNTEHTIERTICIMKKISALLLALVMILLCLSGCAANKKTTYTDKDNFEMKLYPNSENGEKFASGINAVQVILNTPNVEAGAGEIAIYRASDDELMVKYDMRLDGKKIFINTSKNPAFSQIIVNLPEDKCFESGESYYVTVDEDFIYVDDIKASTKAVKKGEWQFTIADYGYDGNIAEMPITYLVGSKISVPIKLGDNAARAVLLYDNVSVVKSDLREISENGTFELDTLSAGTATISVMFLDENGMYIETLGFTVTVK